MSMLCHSHDTKVLEMIMNRAAHFPWTRSFHECLSRVDDMYDILTATLQQPQRDHHEEPTLEQE